MNKCIATEYGIVLATYNVFKSQFWLIKYAHNDVPLKILTKKVLLAKKSVVAIVLEKLERLINGKIGTAAKLTKWSGHVENIEELQLSFLKKETIFQSDFNLTSRSLTCKKDTTIQSQNNRN